MNKLLQNVNLAGTSLFLQILGVSHKQAAVQFVMGADFRACRLHAQQQAVRSGLQSVQRLFRLRLQPHC
jgi:hypothetical protein